MLLAPGGSTALFHLGFRLYLPSPDLRACVRHYWTLDCQLEHPLVEHVYPDGGIGIIFDLEQSTRINAHSPSAPCFFDGIHSEASRVEFRKRSACIGVRFHPGGAARLTSTPVYEIGNQPLALDTVGVNGIERIADRLRSTPSAPDRLKLVESWLRTSLHERPVRHDDIATAVRYIAADPACSVRKLASDMGYSPRKLERLFRLQIGMPAKKLARLHRIRRARDLMKTNRELSLTDVALISGYYDQPHFIKDFRSLSGMTPSEYQRARGVP